MKILVVEDDPSVQVILKTILEHQGNRLSTRDSFLSGKKAAIEGDFDIIILDLGLPDGDGYELCKDIRENKISTPILILSGESEANVKVKCLRVGADDFITKPFNSEELIARIEAIKRRSVASKDQVLTCGEIKVDLYRREVQINSEKVSLTNNEYNLLVYFIHNKNKIITQEELGENVWDIHFNTQTNYINVYISYLRKKIRNYTNTEYIKTVRKKGFILKGN